MNTEYVSFESLYLAYKDCRRHKRNKLSSVKFESNLYENLMALYEELNSGTYQIGVSIAFVVTKPKYREVFAADFRDRIVHHLLIRRLEPYFEEYFDESAYACRKGKGTLYGIKDIRSKMIEVSQNFTLDAWILKTDINGFFMNINKDILKKDLILFMNDRCLSWENLLWWINLAVLIIDNRPELNCEKHGDKTLWSRLPKGKSLFNTDGHKGLPIGNLPSLFYANFYLTPFDLWVLHQLELYKKEFSHLKVESGRYADDKIVVANNKEFLLKVILNEGRKFLKDSRDLDLHPKKVYLLPVKHGVIAFGTIISGKGVLLPGKRTIGNAWNTIRLELFNTLATHSRVSKMIMRVNSYFGYLKCTSSYKIRKLYTRIILHSKFRPFIESLKCKYIKLKRNYKYLNYK